MQPLLLFKRGPHRQRAGALSVLLLLAVLQSGCGRNSGYQVVEAPMEHFAYAPDPQPGAPTITDLSCLLFLALQGQIDFDSLRHFIPDSSVVAAMYQATGRPAEPQQIARVADSAAAMLYRQFLETSSQPVAYRTSWMESQLKKIHLLQLPENRLPTQRIILEAQSDKHTLRASVLCFQLNDRWFLGERLRFGV